MNFVNWRKNILTTIPFFGGVTLQTALHFIFTDSSICAKAKLLQYRGLIFHGRPGSLRLTQNRFRPQRVSSGQGGMCFYLDPHRLSHSYPGCGKGRIGVWSIVCSDHFRLKTNRFRLLSFSDKPFISTPIPEDEQTSFSLFLSVRWS